MKIFLGLILLIVILQVSCTKKDHKPNTQTIVMGRAYDNLNKEPCPGLKLLIGEYHQHYSIDNGSPNVLLRYLDSAVTDSNGNYKMTFTTGSGNNYHLSLANVPNNVRFISDKNGTYSKPYSEIEQIKNIGSTINYNFDVYRQYYMRLRIIFNNNPSPPMTVMAGSAEYPLSGFPCTIYGKSNDTIVNIPISKNTGGFTLLFYITDPAAQKLLQNPLIPLNPVISKDTIEGAVYTVYPSTFK